MLAIIAVLFVVVAIYLFNFYQNVQKYPLGPRPWPLVGNILEIPLHNMHIHVTKFKEKYGPVYTVWQPQPVVYLQDFEHIHEALVTRADDYAGRNPKFFEALFQVVDNGGVIFSEAFLSKNNKCLLAQGPQWKEDRRLSLQILRDFGMGRNIMEEQACLKVFPKQLAQVRLSLHECMDHIRSLPDHNSVEMRWPLQVSHLFSCQMFQLLVANVINRILFGYSYSYHDCERLKEFCDRLNDLFSRPRMNPLTHLSERMPWIKKLPLIGYNAVGQYIVERDKMRKHVRDDIARTLKDYQPGKEPETFVQAWIAKRGNSTEVMDRLENVCVDFFVAGSETTSTTLRWGCIYLSKYPEVQEKIREEIFEVVGTKAEATLKHRNEMPYTTAAIMELQRVANILSFNVPHKTTVDTTVGKFKIPANTEVQPMINTIHNSDPAFVKASEFKPGRFLEKDGKTFNKEIVDRLAPFSLGKRQCAGESLARVELFLGLVALLQNFHIKVPKDAPLDTTPLFGGILSPPANNFVLEVL